MKPKNNSLEISVSNSIKSGIEATDNLSTNLELFITLEQNIVELTEENFDFSLHQTMKLFDHRHPYSYNLIISHLIYYGFCSQPNSSDIYIYIKYIKSIQAKEKEMKINTKLIEVFVKYLSNIESEESYYIIEKFIEEKLIDTNNTRTDKENKDICYKLPKAYRSHFVSTLSKNDFELHKKYIEEGHNPSEIAKIIRKDEIEKLQEISSQSNFNYDQRIKPSLYERCSFINKPNVTLIDYAAFFSSIKCFKYLLMNGAKLENTGKYAVAGGNEEIIHLCEQNHSSFDKAYETAIEFHRNDIFKFFYENNIKKLIDNDQNETLHDQQTGNILFNINEIRCFCVECGNYEILSFLEEDKVKYNSYLVNRVAKIGNIYIVKYLSQKNQIPKNILAYASQSENIELVEYVVKQKELT